VWKQPGVVKWGTILAMMLVLAAMAGPGAGQGTAVQGTEFGEPIQGIGGVEFELFRLGLEDFLEVEDADEGLGPLYNGRSCAECHATPAIGGTSTITEVRAGTLHADGTFQSPPGGSLIHLFSIPDHAIQAAVPEGANVVARRQPIPLFGDGLVESVPDEVLAALEDPEDQDGDGVSGRVHWVVDRDSGETRAGRFGWKAQQSSLFTFGAEAYRNEMGITSDLFLNEMCPAGDCEPLELIDAVADPEDGPDPSTGLRGIDNFANFMRLLGPPPRGAENDRTRSGEELFEEVQCSACHVPTLQTGSSPFEALSNRTFSPFGDFLLHDVGTGDGIQDGDAGPTEIRTAPLWGVAARAPYLHDGSAATIEAAILRHRVEAEDSRTLFEALTTEEREALLAFLRSL
jgi:CxxC motif-containing protein (DUF1111 family)